MTPVDNKFEVHSPKPEGVSAQVETTHEVRVTTPAGICGMGHRMKRKEDPRFIQGKGRYIDDIKLPGMLYMDIVRSPYAHAKINSIDTAEALATEGVLSVITGEDKDSFIPFVTSYINFSFQSQSNISIGGAFGIGFPFGGADQSISFLAGPSLIIGKAGRIVINGGLVGAKVDRLAQGLEVGDPVGDTLLEVPTRRRYELGWFFGLSFNLTSGGL